MRLDQDPRWLAAHNERTELTRQRDEAEQRYDRARGVRGTEPERQTESAIERARRLLTGAERIDPGGDLANLRGTVEALRRAAREADARVKQVERDLSREYRDAQDERIAALDRQLLDALRAVRAANEARQALRDEAESQGFDAPCDEGFEAERIASLIELAERDEALRRAIAAADPNGMTHVRLGVADPCAEVRGHIGAVVTVPETLAVRLLHFGQAERVSRLERIGAVLGAQEA